MKTLNKAEIEFINHANYYAKQTAQTTPQFSVSYNDDGFEIDTKTSKKKRGISKLDAEIIAWVSNSMEILAQNYKPVTALEFSYDDGAMSFEITFAEE